MFRARTIRLRCGHVAVLRHRNVPTHRRSGVLDELLAQIADIHRCLLMPMLRNRPTCAPNKKDGDTRRLTNEKRRMPVNISVSVFLPPFGPLQFALASMYLISCRRAFRPPLPPRFYLFSGRGSIPSIVRVP